MRNHEIRHESRRDFDVAMVMELGNGSQGRGGLIRGGGQI